MQRMSSYMVSLLLCYTMRENRVEEIILCAMGRMICHIWGDSLFCHDTWGGWCNVRKRFARVHGAESSHTSRPATFGGIWRQPVLLVYLQYWVELINHKNSPRCILFIFFTLVLFLIHSRWHYLFFYAPISLCIFFPTMTYSIAMRRIAWPS